jgi:hypothetical protein
MVWEFRCYSQARCFLIAAFATVQSVYVEGAIRSLHSLSQTKQTKA